MSETAQILQELKQIKDKLVYIEEHMVDVDAIMTPAERSRHEEGLLDLKFGRTTSLERVKKGLQHVKGRVR
ncbi:MAG TPA: hypothetical protein VJB87_00265 [Candidatus Nanoarchaeia archaeon]|nr:hypothetical protein [Candidatus Nanoarchaeia archaeon]